MKKLLSAALALLVVLMLVPTIASAAEEHTHAWRTIGCANNCHVFICGICYETQHVSCPGPPRHVYPY